MIKWLWDYDLSPEDNVQKDFLMFESFDEFQSPILVRVHTFSRYCATSGYLSRLRDHTERCFLKEAIPLLRRVSGGSVAFHGEDLCMSFFFRTKVFGERSYRSCVRKISNIVADVLEEGTGIPVDRERTPFFNRGESEYCLARKDESDIFLGQVKIAGFAGRVRKNRFLIHLQINTPGWEPIILKRFSGLPFKITDEYVKIKKFVFSKYFIENIKEQIEYVFPSLFRKDGRTFNCLTG